MKRFLSLLLVAVMLTCVFSSCANNTNTPSDTTVSQVTTADPAQTTGSDSTAQMPISQKMATVILGTEPSVVYTVDLDDVEITNGLISVLDYLKEKEGLEVVYEDSGYGAYLTQIGDIKQDAANGVYIYLWTSVEKDFDVSQYATTVTVNGMTLTSSGVGASQMTVEEDCVIYIGTVTF